MKQELKPCPFCGLLPQMDEKDPLIWCDNIDCPASTVEVNGYDVSGAVDRWNAQSDQSGESTEIDWEQRKWEVIKIFAGEMYGEYWRELARPDHDEDPYDTMLDYFAMAIRDAGVFINQLKQQSDE